MSAYLEPIKMAIILFPVVAIFISLPILVYHYYKFGVFLKWKGIVIYSFVLYMLVAYFLVILPLPDRESVAKLTTIRYNIEPFLFVRTFLSESTLKISDSHTYFPALKEHVFIQPAFNVLLTVPFGVYLRYAFKKSWLQTLFLSFCLSLFFELTQLSGLYGYYPRSYRLFDVDDLLLNTVGGWLGYALTPIIAAFFPTEEELKQKEKVAKNNVSYLRRGVAFVVDYFIFTTLDAWLVAIMPFDLMISFVFLSVYFIAIPAFVSNGQTLGMRIVNIRYADENGKKASLHQLIIRQGLMGTNYFLIVYLLNKALVATGTAPEASLDKLLFLIIALLVYALLFALNLFINLLLKKEQLFYEKIAHTKIMNTK